MAKDKTKAKDKEPPEDNDAPEHPKKFSGARVYEEALDPLVTLIQLYCDPDFTPSIQTAVLRMHSKGRAPLATIWAGIPAEVRTMVEPLTDQISDVFQDDPEYWKILLQVTKHIDHTSTTLTQPNPQKFDGKARMGAKGYHNGKATLWYLCEAGASGIARAKTQHVPK